MTSISRSRFTSEGCWNGFRGISGALMWRTGAGGAANLFRWPDFARRSCNAGWQFWCRASSSLLYPTFESNAPSVLSSRRITNVSYRLTFQAGCLCVWSGHTGRFSSENPEETLPSTHKHSHAESVSMFLELYLFLWVWWPRYNACVAEILLATIYHPVVQRHMCAQWIQRIQQIKSTFRISMKKVILPIASDPLCCRCCAPLGSNLFVFSFLSERRRFPHENEAESAGEIIVHFGLSTPKSLISCGTTSESTTNPSSTAITQATRALSRGRWI